MSRAIAIKGCAEPELSDEEEKAKSRLTSTAIATLVYLALIFG